MFLPKSGRDPSATFENDLAETLRIRKPDFDRTQVDLTLFKPLKAKIDCFQFWRREGFSHEQAAVLQRSLSGKLKRSNQKPQFVTIHDPTASDIRYLLQNHPTYEVRQIEIAIDAYLPDGSNDIYLLRQLKEQIRHCAAPNKHGGFGKTTRTYCALPSMRATHDAASKLAPLTTVTYKAGINGMSQKLYIKTLDQGHQVERMSVRTELRMDVSDWAGLESIGDFPQFGKNMRKFCSPAFFIGNGFKSGDEDGLKWQNYGAVWSFNASKGMTVNPNAVVNRAFGDALNDLGRSLSRL